MSDNTMSVLILSCDIWFVRRGHEQGLKWARTLPDPAPAALTWAPAYICIIVYNYVMGDGILGSGPRKL